MHWNRWSEKFLTHPSTLRRAQAIARLANLSKERVAQLLAEPVPSSGHLQIASDPSLFYPLATSGSVAQKAFSTEFKQSISLRSYLLLFAVVAAMPALLLRICDLLNLFSSEFLAFVFSLLISVALLLGLLNFLPFLGASRLASRMLSRAVFSDLLAACAQLCDHGGQSELVDPAHAARGDLQRDPALLVFDPEPLVLEVDLEATLRVTVRVADIRTDERLLAGDLALARHGTSP